jgi:cell division protein FtsA
LAVGLRTPIPEAEKIKYRHACAWTEILHNDGAIEIASVGDRPPRTIFARNLTEIIEPRAQELLVMIRDDLRRAGMERQIQAGFVLTGGGAQLNGFGELAEHVFQLPVRLGEPRGIMDMPESVVKPEYATVAGLVLHAAKTRRTNSQKGNTLVSKLKAMFAGA